MEFNYNKLRGRIIEKYGTQSNFIKMLSFSSVSFINKLKGRSYFEQNQINEIIQLLDIDKKDIPEYFFYNEIKKT